MALLFDDDESTGSIYTTTDSSDHEDGLEILAGNRRATFASFSSSMPSLSTSSSSMTSQRSWRTMSRIRQLLETSSGDCESASTREALDQVPTPTLSEKWRANFTRRASHFDDPCEMFQRDVSEEASESSIRDFLSIASTTDSARRIASSPPSGSSADTRQGTISSESSRYPFLRQGGRGSGTRARLSKTLPWRKATRK
jgi:hypothetical protein